MSDTTLLLTCDVCEHPIKDPLNKGALVWEIVIRENTVFNTAFRITHRLPGCIQHSIEGERPQWRYLSDFFVRGRVDFGVLLDPKYDDFGYRIDPDAEYDLVGLNAILIRMADVLENEEEPPKPMQPKPRKPIERAGYVYLVQSPTGTYKIGRTVDPNDRMKTFHVKLPFEVEYVCIIATIDRFALESELHRKFKSQRVNGEFFRLSPEDVDYIKGLAK